MSAAAAMALNEDIKQSIYIREMLNGADRRFVYSKGAQDSYEKVFSPVNHDVRLLNFAKDQIGAISDCYILYAVSMMGVCDIESVMLFLRVLSNKHKDLSISDMKDYDGVKKRFTSLVKNGFLFKHRYEFKTEDASGKKTSRKIVNMYSIERSGQLLISQKLGTRLNVNEWIDAKPLNELMGWAACGYVKGRIVESGRFVEHKQGVVRTRAIGTAMYPGEVKMLSKNGESINVAFIQGFMRHNKAAQTRAQYEDSCLYTVNIIKQFFYLRDVQKKLSRMVVVVEDNPDLMTVADFIHSSGILSEDYDRIYFTGEGVVRAARDGEDVSKSFLKIRDNGDGTYDFEPAAPDFIN